MIKYPFLSLKELTTPIAEELNAAAAEVIDSGWFVNGKKVAQFEENLKNLCKTEYAVGTSNGLDALRLILRGYIELGVMKEGDELIVPADTYIATVLAITDNKLVPVFVEPDINTLNLDTSLIESHITPKTKGIMVVHLYGSPCWDETLVNVAKKYNLKVIEDNAQAIGAKAKYPGFSGNFITGGLGDAAGNSFYPTKNLGALGDAGAVTTNDKELAEVVKALSNYGSNVRYNNLYQGLNCRLDEMQAALLSVKMNYLEAENAHRRKLAAIYNNTITNPAIIKPLIEREAVQVWHQYVLRTENRDRFKAYLTENDVGCDILYPVPPHLQPCYKEYANLHLPVACEIANTVISIPISSMTSEQDAKEIADIINSFRG